MREIRCLIVDDEELARTLLENYTSRLPFLKLQGQAKNPLEAIALLQEREIDLLFLDIQMPELTGIELLKTLPHKPLIIFTTAYPDYALEGYALDVIDYLLKPFSFERFTQAVNRAAERLRLVEAARSARRQVPETESAEKDFLLVKSEHKIYRVPFDDILYIQSMREYVAFYLPSGRILSLGSLKDLEKTLPAERFIRTHKSYIVALDKVKYMEGNLLYVGSEKIPVGASYREEVIRRVF